MVSYITSATPFRLVSLVLITTVWMTSSRKTLETLFDRRSRDSYCRKLYICVSLALYRCVIRNHSSIYFQLHWMKLRPKKIQILSMPAQNLRKSWQSHKCLNWLCYTLFKPKISNPMWHETCSKCYYCLWMCNIGATWIALWLQTYICEILL